MLRKIIISIRDWYLIKVKWKRYTFGENFHAGRNVFLWAKKSITIGDNCYIGRNSQIECNVTLGNNVLIANNVAFIGKYDHNYQQIGVPIRQASQVSEADYTWLELDRETIVGDDVWIGFGAIIISGVNIAEGSIIAAGSIITKDTKAYGIYAGSPAKRLAERFDSKENLEEHLSILKNKS